MLLTAGAVLLVIVIPDVTRASQTHVEATNRAYIGPSDAWPTVARSMAGTVALRWAANVLGTARLGAEPPGRCRRLDDRHAACPIGIAVLASGAADRRPWRCSATVLVSRAGDRLAGRRTDTRCAPFPPPSAVPDAAAALGTAFALDANGDIACLTAGNGRVTCVMSYSAPTGEGCIGAASVPLSRPARSVALGEPVCRARRSVPRVGRARPTSISRGPTMLI